MVYYLHVDAEGDQEMEETRLSRTQAEHRRQEQHFKWYILAAAVALVLVVGIFLLAGRGGGTQQNPSEPSGENSPVLPVTAQSSETPADGQEEAPVPVVPEEESWKTVLVNSTHALPDGYVPELVAVEGSGYKMDARAVEDMNAMLRAARAEGLSPMICSSYRSWERQTELFEQQVAKQQATGLSYEEAYEKAKTVVAYPGTSEHQTGLTADIVATSYQLLDDAQADTPEQQWLMANSWKYGFILRYPQDKSDLTGIIYEPWHYRYVGYEVAKYITEEGLCLEEYWQKVEAQQAQQTAQRAD